MWARILAHKTETLVGSIAAAFPSSAPPGDRSVSGLFIESLGEGAYSENRTPKVQHLSASGWTFVPELLLTNSNTLLKFIWDSLLCVLLMLVRVVMRNREGGLRG